MKEGSQAGLAIQKKCWSHGTGPAKARQVGEPQQRTCRTHRDAHGDTKESRASYAPRGCEVGSCHVSVPKLDTLKLQSLRLAVATDDKSLPPLGWNAEDEDEEGKEDGSWSASGGGSLKVCWNVVEDEEEE